MTREIKPPEHGRPNSAVGDFFRRFSRGAADRLGSTWSFVAAIVVVLAWAVTGPIFHYSNAWQLVINTGTTIVTFLMVFLIQNSQNRDSVAIHLKLDELIRAVADARNGMVDLENRSDEELREVRAEFAELTAGGREKSER